MNLGEKLLSLRKMKYLSQEEAAEALDVTRQTISKWETNQSTPDYDKIIPICNLYGITPDELFLGIEKEENNEVDVNEDNNNNKNKRAIGIGIGVFIYFLAVIWIMISIPVLMINPIVGSAIFLGICGVATVIIIYTCIVYKKEKKELTAEEKLLKQIDDILGLITFVIYILISFITGAFHITWIIFIIYGVITEIIKLSFMLRREKNEK